MKNLFRHLTAACCASLVGGAAFASGEGRIGSASVADLQSMVNEIAATSGAVGAQVSVILGEQRADFVYGTANTELQTPMTVDTIVQVGSTTKLFNAALIMTLVDEGKLSLDTPVLQYIPGLKLSDKNALQGVTLRHLLSMSSGFDNGPHIGLYGDDALARYVAQVGNIPPVFAPGNGFGYSNAGICIAGYAAQRAGGMSWEALVHKRLFEAAGLKHVVTLPENFAFHRVSLGYTPTPNGPVPNRPWALSQGEAPAGGTLLANAHDLASFGQLFVNGGKAANGTRVLSEVALKTMMTPTTDVPVSMPTWGIGQKWGLGPNMSKWGEVTVWGHAGSNQNGSSQLLWIPEKRAVLAFVLNTPASLDPFSVQMFDRFSSAVFGISGPKMSPPASPAEVWTKRYVGEYQRFGMRYEVTEQAGRLRYKQINLGGIVPPEIMPLGVLLDAELTALGGDRFLAVMPGGGGLPVGFFGSDAQRRATNLVDPVFAAGRVK